MQTNLASLKTEVDKLNIDKLVPIPVDLSKLSDVVKNDVVKKTDYGKLVAKVNSIDTSGFVLKTKCGTDKSELENKIPDTSGLVEKTNYDAKIADIEGKIPSVSSLVKKAGYDTKMTEIENKLNNHNYDQYITEFNTLAADVFNARLSQANLVTKTNIDNTVLSLDSKIAKNKTKNESIENEFKKLKNI